MASGGGSDASCRTWCSVCLEPFIGRSPKILPCFHTFCLPCLIQVAETSMQRASTPVSGDSSTTETQQGFTICCPACRKQVPVPDGDVSKFQSNFYLEQDEDKNHLQPIICDLCNQGQVASHHCTKCQMKLCFHCNRLHGECQSSAPSTKETEGTSEADKALLLQKGKSQMGVLAKMLIHCAEEEKELHTQRKTLENTVHTLYTTGLARLAEARNEVLQSVRIHTQCTEEKLKREMTNIKKKHHCLAEVTSKHDAVNLTVLETILMSDLDISNFQKRMEQDTSQFFRLETVDRDVSSTVSGLRELVFGAVQVTSGLQDFIMNTVDSGDCHSPSSDGDGNAQPPVTVRQDTSQASVDYQKLNPVMIEDLVQKVELLQKKVAENERQEGNLQGEMRDLKKDLLTVKQRNSVLEEKVAKLQGQNTTLKEDVSQIQTGQQMLHQDLSSVGDQSSKLTTTIADLKQSVYRFQSSYSQELGDQKSKLLLHSTKHEARLSRMESKIAELHSQVAFHAFLHNSFTAGNTRRLICKEVVSNIGHAYNPQTGIFTAPCTGLYAFLATVSTHRSDKQAAVDMLLEDSVIGYASCTTTETGSTCHAVVHVMAGQRVLLEIDVEQARGCSFSRGKLTSFSGFLVQKNC